MSRRTVTLVAPDERSRTDLAGYLRQSGFAVRALVRPRMSELVRSLVWLTDRDGDLAEAADRIDRWLAENGTRRAVVVTWRPVAFRGLCEVHRGRVVVLAAPVFGWQVVDALAASRSRGAG